VTLRTTQPAIGTLCTGPKDGAALTFDPQGTFSDRQHARITNGTFQVTNSSSGQTMYGELIKGGAFTNNTGGGLIFIAGIPNRFAPTPHYCAEIGDALSITTSCSTAGPSEIDVSGRTVDNFGSFRGAVECYPGGGDTTQSSPSSMTGTTQDRDSSNRSSSSDTESRDGDGDGIPDSNDNCTHGSNPRCFKEGR
ncbi:MAG: hypothetical protein ACJ70Z_03965, partial [Nitrososphaera sp.]